MNENKHSFTLSVCSVLFGYRIQHLCTYHKKKWHELDYVSFLISKQTIINAVSWLIYIIICAQCHFSSWFTGGYLAHSLAIMTDAAHLLTDFGSMMVSLFSLWISSRPPTKTMNFGWHRSGENNKNSASASCRLDAGDKHFVYALYCWSFVGVPGPELFCVDFPLFCPCKLHMGKINSTWPQLAWVTRCIVAILIAHPGVSLCKGWGR